MEGEPERLGPDESSVELKVIDEEASRSWPGVRLGRSGG
jgi:hypothetical protein